MSKRKLTPADPLVEQFQTLRQVKSLSHVQCREVLTLLNQGAQKTGKRAGTQNKHKYPVASLAVRQVPLRVAEKEILLQMFSLPQLTQNKVSACPLFRECFLAALQKSGNSLDLLVYWDEAVLGNVLAPDLRRKSAMTYVCYSDFPVLWRDTAWMTLSVCRSQDLQTLPDGCPRSFSAMLEEIDRETKDGFMIDFGTHAVLVHLRQITILADADGLRLLTGSKGASGLKPCFKCGNIVSGDHINLTRHEHISSKDIHKWQKHSKESLQAISMYLDGIAGKTAKEKAETQLGWNGSALKCSALLNVKLQDLLPFNGVCFDPMHCFVSNGIACQELGLWYTALTRKCGMTHSRLRGYAHQCWQPCLPDTYNMDKLFAGKLWVADKDFRGDASETLQVMSICVAFSHEIVLPVVEDMKPEIDSLTALYAVILCWLRAKYGDAAAQATLLEELQKNHVSLFVSTYGPEMVRPKLHFSLHLPQQFREQGKAVDAFPGERKHIYFKQNVAPRCKNLTHFNKTVLLELGEMDGKTNEKEFSLTTQLLNPCPLEKPLSQLFGSSNWSISEKMYHAGQSHAKEQYNLLPNGKGVKILGAAQKDNDFFILCQEMTSRKNIAPGFSSWICPEAMTNMSLLPIDLIQKCHTAALKRVERKDATTDICLLLG